MRKKWIVPMLAAFLLFGTSCKIPDVEMPGPVEAESTDGSGHKGPPVLSMPAKKDIAEVSSEEPQAEEAPQNAPHITGTLTTLETAPVLTAGQMPDDYEGLELPVRGATGYASVYLPMWRDPSDSDAAQQAIAEWTEREKKRQQERALQKAQEQAKLADQAADEAAAAAETAAKAAENAVPQTDNAVNQPTTEGTPPTEGAQENPSSAEAGETSAAGEQVVPTAVPLPPEQGTQTADPEGIPTEQAPAATPEPAAEPAPEPEDPKPSATAGVMAILPAGTDFTVLEEQGKWWKIQCTTDYQEGGQQLHGETIGWVEHRWCMINLPDVIPSMIYDAANGYDSKFVSCGKPLKNITGRALYPGRMQNDRLGEREFMMPVLYAMAPRLCAAQRAALAQGNSLVLYEGYRPLETQVEVSRALRALMQEDAEVKAAVSSAPWGIGWFIATGASNHQHGYAVDVSLARVVSAEERRTGNFRYIRTKEYDLYQMPTAIHELSRAAVTFTAPVGSNSMTAWKSAKLAPSMTQTAIALQGYCTGAELSPLASEWWHFNDLTARQGVISNLGKGDFQIKKCRSTAPEG